MLCGSLRPIGIWLRQETEGAFAAHSVSDAPGILFQSEREGGPSLSRSEWRHLVSRSAAAVWLWGVVPNVACEADELIRFVLRG